MTWDPSTVFVSAFSVLFLALGWSETFWWRHREELVEVEAEVLSVSSAAEGGRLADVRYAIGGRVFERRLSRADAIRSIDEDAERVRLFVHPRRPKRVSGNPMSSLWSGIFFVTVAVLAPVTQWRFQWLDF